MIHIDSTVSCSVFSASDIRLQMIRQWLRQVRIIRKPTSMCTLTIPVSFHHIPEQTAIAEVLSDMDAELNTLEARRDKTRALKQGMMQELLTGRTRLV